jgi:pyrroline-5-carboxylate reductase
MNLSTQKIGIIGFGNMGQALFHSFLKITDVINLYACDRDPEKFAQFPRINICRDAKEVLQQADIVIIAVKPQSFTELVEECSAQSVSNKLIISIMAGVPASKIKQGFPDAKIVRAMPNIAVKAGAGVTAWFTEDANEEEKQLVKAIFASTGFELEIPNEELLHAVTAISGCGPAYFYYFTESLEEAGVQIGLAKEEAQQLARHTFIGAAKLLEKDQSDPATLRQAVASKGGSTEQALKSFEENNVKQKIIEGVQKAKSRSIELSQNS